MIKALVIKELREVYWLGVLALVAYLVPVTAHHVGGGRYLAPFASDLFVKYFAAITGPFAVALGLRQSVWEGWHGLYQFLLFRPLRRDAIFLTKLATGAALLLACSAVPLVGYALWAAMPGHHPSPFEWSMTENAWRAYLAMPLLYLGAFLSGLRPAHWFGTRLLPLAAAFGFAVFVMVALPWWLALPLAALLYGVFLSAICHVGRTRDYA